MNAQARTGMDTGFVLYDDKGIVARLNGRGKKVVAYIQFAGLRIDISNAVEDALASPMTYEKLRDNCWKKIMKRIDQSKDNPLYSSILTRLSVGNGENTLRNRMNQIVNAVYYNWYTVDERIRLEQEKYDKNYYSHLIR